MKKSYKIYRTYDSENEETFIIEFPEGKTIADIEDAIFLVKEQEGTLLSDAKVTKTLIGGDITLHNLDVAKVKWLKSDYVNLEIDVLYKAAFFCKWAGDADYDENVERIFDFQLKQNFHNNL